VPRAIDAAFRLYMLPQGMFSVAVATVLFPALARLATRRDIDGLRALTGTGTRQIFLLLIPAAACTLVLAEPITRLVYQRGEFDADSTDIVAEALFWFSFSLPFAGVNLLLTRTFFSLQRPWLPTGLGAATLLVNLVVALVLVGPFGIGGIVVATAVASAAMTAGQAYYLRRELGGRLEGAETARAVARMLLAATALALVAYLSWRGLDALLGRSLPASTTAQEPLPGAVPRSRGASDWSVEEAALRTEMQRAGTGWPTAVVERLLGVYGTRCRELLALSAGTPELGRVVGSGRSAVVAAEVVLAVRQEGAVHLTDLLHRRTMVGLEPGFAREVERPVAELAAPLLGWSPDDVDREVAAHGRYVEERLLGGLRELVPPVPSS
jgi:hypothetical protein